VRTPGGSTAPNPVPCQTIAGMRYPIQNIHNDAINNDLSDIGIVNADPTENSECI
jgi:hypothetical protein